MSNIRESVRNFIRDKTGLENAEAALEDDSSLEDALGSMLTVRLIAYLEERFHIELGPDDLEESSFSSIDSICRMVATKIASSGSAKLPCDTPISDERL